MPTLFCKFETCSSVCSIHVMLNLIAIKVLPVPSASTSMYRQASHFAFLSQTPELVLIIWFSTLCNCLIFFPLNFHRLHRKHCLTKPHYSGRRLRWRVRSSMEGGRGGRPQHPAPDTPLPRAPLGCEFQKSLPCRLPSPPSSLMVCIFS